MKDIVADGGIFDQTWVLSEIDRLQTLIEPHLTVNGSTVVKVGTETQEKETIDTALEELREWVKGRKAKVLADVDTAEWPWAERYQMAGCADVQAACMEKCSRGQHGNETGPVCGMDTNYWGPKMYPDVCAAECQSNGAPTCPRCSSKCDSACYEQGGACSNPNLNDNGGAEADTHTSEVKDPNTQPQLLNLAGSLLQKESPPSSSLEGGDLHVTLVLGVGVGIACALVAAAAFGYKHMSAKSFNAAEEAPAAASL